MKTVMKFGLFGGALVAAGIAANPAAAAAFTFDPDGYQGIFFDVPEVTASNTIFDNGTSEEANNSYKGYHFDSPYFYENTLSATYANISGSSHVLISTTEIAGDVSVTGTDGRVESTVRVDYLSVDVTGTVTVTWDFTNYATAYEYFEGLGTYDVTSGLALIRDSNLNTVLTAGALGTSGSATAVLTAGEEYLLNISLKSGAPGSMFVSFTIPTPGSIALLGVAGVLDRRKRRRA